jgi:hypothetical protein
VNTLIKPHIPSGSEPPGDDDPTGVRDLLSSLPEPDPMPEHLIERINASLAAEQAQRAAKIARAPVTPLRATSRRGRTRVLLAIAGAAAAVALLTFAGTNLFTAHQASTTSASAGISSTPSATGATAPGGAATGAAVPGQPGAGNKAPALAAAPMTPSLVQVSVSGTRYTQADFVTQARKLRLAPLQPMTAAASSTVGPTGTAAGLMQCLKAIGAAGAQAVRADVAFYEGRPAMVIVATTNGTPMAYAVGRECSQTNAALLRPATPLS